MSVALVRKIKTRLRRLQVNDRVEYSIPPEAEGFNGGLRIRGEGIIIKIMDNDDQFPLIIARYHKSAMNMCESEIVRIIHET